VSPNGNPDSLKKIALRAIRRKCAHCVFPQFPYGSLLFLLLGQNDWNDILEPDFEALLSEQDCEPVLRRDGNKLSVEVLER